MVGLGVERARQRGRRKKISYGMGETISVGR
jgi:hypothetical protein